MRTVAWWLAGSLALVALGCSGGGATSPTAPSTNGSSLPTGSENAPISVSGSLGTAIQKGDLQTSALAIYSVDINTDTLTATARLKETRSGQANDDLYLLSIDSFLNAGSFKITDVSADTDSVDLGYVVTHPFPAPSDPAGTPNGSSNRADLGISGMVLFLADVASATGNTYFTDVVANTALVTNADAYYQPGGLLTTTGLANTYPYLQLVDERADSREGITNGGNVDGNFGTDGWTRSELGAGNNGWTGGGVLHGGQSSANSVSLDKTELSGGFSLDVAIVGKYGDPRGGTTGAQKKANRLPPAAADATKFAYRIPHNSLDGAKIVVESDPAGFIANTISAAQISVHVVDSDARATETVATDLSEDLGFQTVAVGEAGLPTVEICIPGVNGDATTVAAVPTVVDDDTLYGGDAGADTGAADDALFFSDSVSKAAGAGETAGDFTGMVRVTDPETGLIIGLDGALAPLPVAPDAITYQAFTATQLPDNAPPSAVVTLTSADPMNSGTPASLGITSIADADTDNIDVLVDWGNGGGFVSVAAGLVGPAYPDQTPTGPQMNNADLTPDVISMIVRLDDGTVQTDYPVGYTLGPNRAPVVTLTPALAVASLPPPATFTMNAGTATATDPEGDTISRTITNNVNADVVSFANFPNAANTTAFNTPGGVNFTVYANDALHPTTGGTAYPVVAGNVATPCPPAGATVPAGTPITTGWPTFSGSIGLAPDWLFWGTMDSAGWKSTTYTGVVVQNVTGSGTQNGFVLVNFTAPATISSTIIAAFTAGTLLQNTIDVDTDANNRVFYTKMNTTTTSSTASPTPAAKYLVGGASSATTGIRFFDYTGASFTGTPGTIATTAVPMAFCVTHAGHVYYLDINNVLHWLTPSGAATYTEVTSGCGGWPMNLANNSILPAGFEMNPVGVGDLNRKAHDIVYDEHSDAIFILAQSQLVPTLGNGNGFLYRIESNGTYLATVNGQPNPRRFMLVNNSTQALACDINIDNYNAAGALLTGQQNQQIVVTGNNTFVGDAFDMRIFNSSMVNTLSIENSLAPILNATVSRKAGMNAIANQLMVTTASFDACGFLYGVPTNWQ